MAQTAEKLYKGNHSNVYAYRMHIIEVSDPTGWKPTWTATDRLTGWKTCSSVSLKETMKQLDRKLDFVGPPRYIVHY